MLCANCSDIDLFAILQGDHEGIPLEIGHEVWVTRSSDPTAIWVWDSQPGCEFCEFLSATQSNLMPPDASLKPRYLQLDRGKSWIRKDEEFGPAAKISSHVNIVFDSPDQHRPLGEGYTRSYPQEIVSSSVLSNAEVPDLEPFPLQVDEIPTWLDMSSIKRHLQNCLHHHGSCVQQGKASSSRPSRLRVIDCSNRSIVTPSDETPYVALSYRWGKSHTESQDRQIDMLPANVPTTIEDAIQVTQSLGFQHLWVDAYCVLQTDKNDFNHQIRQMHLIYQSAQITIIAGREMDAESGLTGISAPRANMQTRGRYDQLDFITFSLWPWAFLYYMDEWAKRGWTLQESYFSQRRLIFTDKQVLFDCNEGVVSEDLQHSQILYHSGLEKWQPNVEKEEIYRLVEEYTHRVLTYDADTLNAFDGILGAFEQQDPAVRSHWGIPLPFDTSGYLNGLLIGLCWCHQIQDGRIHRQSGFPSWSWAGWSHHLGVFYMLERIPDTKLVVTDQLAIQIEKQNGHIEAWKTFEDAGPASTQRHHYSQRIHLSAPSLEIRLHRVSVSTHWLGPKTYGHAARVVRNEKDGCWSEPVLLDSSFESLELSSDTYKSEEIRTCYAIYLFLADKMEHLRDIKRVDNTFAMLLVSKVGTNWERVGLWMPYFNLREEAETFEQWFRSSPTYETRDFWIA